MVLFFERATQMPEAYRRPFWHGVCNHKWNRNCIYDCEILRVRLRINYKIVYAILLFLAVSTGAHADMTELQKTALKTSIAELQAALDGVAESLLWHPDCVSLLSERQLKLTEVLKDVPELSSYLVEMIEDQSISASVRTLIQRALLDTQTNVYNLTKELRVEWNIPERTNAIAFVNIQRTWSYPSSPPSFNERASQRLSPKIPSGQNILYPDEPMTLDRNPMLVFFHELAHIRFVAYLNQHFEEICARMPYSFKLVIEGQCALNHQFVDYLGERYAWETQFRIGKRTWSKYFRDRITEDLMQFIYKPDRHISDMIGPWLGDAYEYSVPQVRALGNLTLSEILLGGKRLQQVDRVIRFYSDPQKDLPGAEEYPAAFGILTHLWMAEGQVATAAPSPLETFYNVRELLGSENGVQRTRNLLIEVIKYAEAHPKSREALVGLIGSGLFTYFIRSGLDFPTLAFANWKDVEAVLSALRNPT